MIEIIGGIIEGLIQYTLLGVIIAILLMVILLVLLHGRNPVRSFLAIAPLRNTFDGLCELSDRLDEDYIAHNPYGTAMWLNRFLKMGVMAAAGLMILWIIVIAIRG
jgi:hypothetical protein